MIQREAIAEKLQTALLPAMRNHGIDMWIVLDRENNSEPLHVELGGGFSGVRAAFIFFDGGGDTVEKLYYGSHEQPANSVISQIYDETIYYGYSREGLTPHIRKAVHDRDPAKIGVNTSHTLPEADGLTVGLRNFLVEAIGPDYASRIVPAELVVRDFRLQRTPRETAIYTSLLEWTARWMTEALSSTHIATGATTAEDVAWWLQDRALELGLTGWGTVRVVREGELLPIHDPDIPLEPGDILSIDGGLHYLHYAIDIKRAAYILRPGETAMPESLQEAWRTTHEIGDLYAGMMLPGAIGFETWAAINAETGKMGYKAVGPDAGGDAVTSTEPEVGGVRAFGRQCGARHRRPHRGGHPLRVRRPGAVSAAGERVGRHRVPCEHAHSRMGREDLVRAIRGGSADHRRGREVAHPDAEGTAADRARELIGRPAIAGRGVLAALAGCGAPPPVERNPYGAPSERRQWETRRSIVQKKAEEALPRAMRALGVDMWIVIDRENNEEPLHDEVGGGQPGVRGACQPVEKVPRAQTRRGAPPGRVPPPRERRWSESRKRFDPPARGKSAPHPRIGADSCFLPGGARMRGTLAAGRHVFFDSGFGGVQESS